MFFFKRTLKLQHYLGAVFIGALIPMLLGYGMARANPSACYDSPCALPLLLVTTPPVIAPILTLLFAANNRLRQPFPNGLIPTVFLSAIAGQLGISFWSIAIASPNIRRIFFTDILFIPEGFMVSAFIGAVLWLCLFALGRA